MNESRREFLMATGAIAGGLSGYSGAVATETGGRITVAEGEPTLAETTVAFDRERPDVKVETLEADGFETFLHGEAVIQHAARPMTASERERAHENGIGFEEREFPLGGIATVTSDDGWCRCLSTDDQEILGEDGRVEIWSEVVSDAHSDHASADLPEGGTSVFVRGTRAHQYAIGHGGIGYHEASPSTFTQTAANGEQFTHVVRLGFAYVDRDILDHEAVGALLDHHADAASDIEHVEDVS